MKNIVFTTALTFTLTGFAQSDGTSIGHGGHVVNCVDQEPVVLDYYHSTLRKFGDTSPAKIALTNREDQEATVRDFIALLPSPVAQYQFIKARKVIGPMSNWLATSLKNSPDSNETYILPPGCTLVQAAIRQDETVYVDPTVAASLSPMQKGILEIHETLFYIGSKNVKLKTSEAIRDLFRALVTQDSDIDRTNRFISNIRLPTRVLTGLYQGIGFNNTHLSLTIKKANPYTREISVDANSWRLPSGTLKCDENFEDCFSSDGQKLSIMIRGTAVCYYFDKRPGQLNFACLDKVMELP